MRITRRLAFGVASALLGVCLPILAAPASASTDPPWEPDPSALGTLTFYNSSGQVVTGGSDLAHLFDYVEASTVDSASGTKATLVFANPIPPASTPTGNFPTGQGSASTAFPNAGAPAPLNATSNPVVTLASTDANLTNFIASQTVNTVAGYANVYQLRVVTSGPGGVGSVVNGNYWDADVLVDPIAGTWVETYPVQGASATATNTDLSAVPVSTATQGQSVTLTATVTATDSSHPDGSVEFFQDGASLGTGSFVAATGIGTLTTTHLLASSPGGTSLTATFTPTDTSTYSPSTSTGLSYTVNPKAKTPSISGPHQVGGTEKCSEGALDFGVSASYSWLVSGKKVATGKSYVVPASALGKKLSCTAGVHAGGGPTSSATSKSVTVSLGKALKATKKPKLSGSGKTGATEKVAPGSWSPKASSYTYQWLLNGKTIKHATKSSLKLKSSEKGKTISCRVTAHKKGFANGTSTSKGVKVT